VDLHIPSSRPTLFSFLSNVHHNHLLPTHQKVCDLGPDIFMMSNLSVDDQHVLSEFDDPERRRLIQQIVDDDQRLSEIPRSAFFFLWFSDIRRLRQLAAPRLDHERDREIRYWALLATLPYDLAGICKCTSLHPEIILTISTQTRGICEDRATKRVGVEGSVGCENSFRV
jgi:hypothetical protein